jgi:hypothetical protein
MSTYDSLPPHLDRLGRDLVAAAAELQKQSVGTSARARWSRPGLVTRARLAASIALAAVLIAAAALLPNLAGNAGPAPAFAAPLVRFAKAIPRVLLPLPGWHVVDANEQDGGLGGIDFVKGSTSPQSRLLDLPAGASLNRPASVTGRIAALTWYPALQPVEQGQRVSIATGLGLNVTRLFTEGRGKHYIDLSAFMTYDGLGMRFRATVPDMAAFRRELLAIRAVDVTTFLEAMPSNVITSISASGDAAQTIRKMLQGITLPPGFTPTAIKHPNLIRDRYQLGAAVTGTVACIWIRDWNLARNDGNTTMIARTIAAMATSPHWPVLRQMAKEGGWTQVLTGYAKAMPKGTWYGRSLVASAESGLGCRALGVNLEPAR